MLALHQFMSLVSGRIASLSEVIERAQAMAQPEAQAAADHADAFERSDSALVPGGGHLDPLHILDGFRVVDLRDVPDRDRPARGRSVGLRQVADAQALMWHQTGAAALNVDHPRLLGVPAHALVDQDGAIALLHRVTAYVYHGHLGNRWSIGIEVSARAPGIEGNPRTFWRSRSEKAQGLTMADLERPATPQQLEACAALARYYAALMASRGHPLLAWVCHRQTATKASDPGQRIAQHAARIGRDLRLPADWTTRRWGRGQPLPRSWVDTDG